MPGKGVVFEVLLIRVPYYTGDPKRDPNLENCTFRGVSRCVLGLSQRSKGDLIRVWELRVASTLTHTVAVGV